MQRFKIASIVKSAERVNRFAAVRIVVSEHLEEKIDWISKAGRLPKGVIAIEAIKQCIVTMNQHSNNHLKS